MLALVLPRCAAVLEPPSPSPPPPSVLYVQPPARQAAPRGKEGAEYITGDDSSAKHAQNERRGNSQPACRVRDCRSARACRRSPGCPHSALHPSGDGR